jgi:hypothetical protein
MLLHSSSGAGDCMWIYCTVMIDVYALASLFDGECLFVGLLIGSKTIMHKYLSLQSNTPTYSRQLLRINVITFETC